ncbi:MHYT domain-containing protein [Yinghuangia seranimata]|uniref:MHYT domain-containing protein n=1 Tax=Yinghuangia seranimata TaxID=408067 RepID=UPI00248D00D7|nr:MHYT domain-containing protein [Yinghuangia seranimata]MDI2130234.1 MHYT domain-containing protein [Yinghuangia seranimata]
MGDIHHFSSGPLTPTLAYVMSCLGSGLGLLCTSRARAALGWARARWLILAAVSIGGTGIWVMHFIAMLGFSVEGTAIRYDVQRTILSLIAAIAVVGLGLSIVGYAGNRVAPLLLGGVLTGGGVASMHYLGMSALWLRGSIDYDTTIVSLSVVIAVVAATAALWMAFNIRGMLATVVAALIMGVAVTGMHYTAMYSMSVDTSASSGVSHGAEPVQFLAPLITGISLFTFVTMFIVALSPTEDEMEEEAELGARLDRLTENQKIRRRTTVRPSRSPRAAARPAPARGPDQIGGHSRIPRPNGTGIPYSGMPQGSANPHPVNDWQDGPEAHEDYFRRR